MERVGRAGANVCLRSKGCDGLSRRSESEKTLSHLCTGQATPTHTVAEAGYGLALAEHKTNRDLAEDKLTTAADARRREANLMADLWLLAVACGDGAARLAV